MPDAQRKKPAGAAAYLARTLRMNPLYEADQVIALRSRALRLKSDKPQPANVADLGKRRTDALARIEAIRKECWSAPPEQLLSRLDSLELDGLPDVQAAANRLKVVANNRAKLPQLASHKHFDGEFFSCLKTVLAESPRETAVLREQVLASFRSGKLRKRGRRMIKLLESKLPEVYALESDWFSALLRQKTTSTDSALAPADSSASDGMAIPAWAWWIVVFVVIKVLAAIARNS